MAAHGREGLNLEPVERVVFDTPMRCTIAPEDLVSDGRCWAALDYRSVKSTDVTGSLEWRLEQGSALDGLAMWFEADLADGIGFSTRPGPVASCLQADVHSVSPAGGRPGPVAAFVWSSPRVRLATNYVWSWRGWLTRLKALGP